MTLGIIRTGVTMAMDRPIDAQAIGRLRQHVQQIRTVLLRRHAMPHPIEGEHLTVRALEALSLTGNRHHHQTDRQALILRRPGPVHHHLEEEVVQWAEVAEAVHLAAAEAAEDVKRQSSNSNRFDPMV